MKSNTSPFGLDVSSEFDELIICDRDDSSIIIVADLSSFTVKRSFCSRGSGIGQLCNPRALSILSTDLYVADTANSRIQVFTLSDGQPLRSIGKQGDGDGELNYPEAVFATDTAIYVADTYNHRVQLFSPDGHFLIKFGSQGSGPCCFSFPSSLALVNDDQLFIADSGNYRIETLTLDGSFIHTFGSRGSEYGKFCSLFGIYLLAINDQIWVSERDICRLQCFTIDGTFLTAFGARGSDDGDLNEPRCLSSHGSELFVADSCNHRVCAFT